MPLAATAAGDQAETGEAEAKEGEGSGLRHGG